MSRCLRRFWYSCVFLVALTLGLPSLSQAQTQQRDPRPDGQSVTPPPADPAAPQTPAPAAPPADPNAPQTPPAPPQPSSPLAVHIGDTDLLLGGFMDMTGVFRSTNTGNGLGTNFSNFPFTQTTAGVNNPAGNMQEARFSAQNSRITLQTTSKVGNANLKGYLEVDFLGNTSNNLNVTSNSNGLRMRLYWVDYQAGAFEFLAGQSWSLMTPGRTGLSPMPGDIFFSQVVDTNYQMGLTWQRVPGFRFVMHGSDLFTAGLALENPEQYVGGAVVLPAAFQACCLGQVQQGGGGLASSSPTPNVFPDIIGKVAVDPKLGGLHEHIDGAVLIREFKTYNPTTDTSFSKGSFSGSVNGVFEVVKNFKLVAMNFWSHGGGRFIANTATPDFIVNPDFSLNLVKAFSGIYGAEVTLPKTTVYGYYSLDNISQNVTLDTNGKQIGYGVDNSQAPNHKIHETTVGLTETFFRDPKIGGMQLMIQYSYLQRTPFSVPAGTPSDGKLNMVYINVRYILP